jgi:transcriptional regulator with XRE-family HTH domain
VSEETIHERLRRIRLERGESLEALARRNRLRLEWLQAIENGRFSDLPRGIYGRSAIRRHSASLGLDPAEVIASCELLLPALEDQISALGRLRGLPPSRARATVESPGATAARTVGRSEVNGLPAFSELPSWRLLAAAAIDALVVVGLLIVVVTGTVAIGIPVSGLGRTAAPAFALLALVFASCYFVVLGGVAGATLGELVVPVFRHSAESSKLDLHAVSTRTMECVLRDALFIEMMGKWTGRFLAHHGWPWGMSQARHVERPAS